MLDPQERRRCEEYAALAVAKHEWNRTNKGSWDGVVDIIQAARRDAVEGRWVKVSDAMPDEDRQSDHYRRGVLIIDKGGNIHFTVQSSPTWAKTFERFYSVSHWCGLPAPAKGTVQK